MARVNPTALLRALSEADVRFILVGGLAAVVQGVPTVTWDVDVVHDRQEENIQRLLPVLESLDAIFRIQPARRLRPNASHLAGSGHVNLETVHGALDLLCTIGEDLDYESLLEHSSELDVAEGCRVHVLNLETLIAIKEQLSDAKDRAVLPLLRQTLAERNKRQE